MIQYITENTAKIKTTILTKKIFIVKTLTIEMLGRMIYNKKY